MKTLMQLVPLGKSLAGIGLALAFSVVGMLSPLQAAQVNFSSPLNRLNLDASEAELSEDFVFELGAFAQGFTPNIDNIHLWQENWTVATEAVYNPDTGIFAGQFNYESNTAPFVTSNRGYIWGKRLSGGPDEWILIGSPSWRWPAASSQVPAFWSSNVGNPDAVIGYFDSEAKGNAKHMQAMVVGSGASPKLFAVDWRQLFFAGELEDPDTQLDADYSGDGVSNILKFALGEDPRSANGVRMPDFVSEKANGKEFAALKVERNPVANVKYLVEYSTDLKKWDSDGLVTVVDESDTLVVRDVVPRNERKRMFLRLRVEP